MAQQPTTSTCPRITDGKVCARRLGHHGMCDPSGMADITGEVERFSDGSLVNRGTWRKATYSPDNNPEMFHRAPPGSRDRCLVCGCPLRADEDHEPAGRRAHYEKTPGREWVVVYSTAFGQDWSRFVVTVIGGVCSTGQAVKS